MVNRRDRGDELTISVVIPSHNRAGYLPTMLRRLLEDGATEEILVVADACSDGTASVVREFREADARVALVETPGLGAAGARQAGAEAASGDLLLFLDDDIVPDPDLVSAHLTHHAAADDPSLVVLGYMPTSPPEIDRPSAFPNRLYAREYEDHVIRWEQGENPLLLLWAGHLSIRRRAALDAGMHDEELALRYHEDTALGLRLLEHGLRARFDRSLGSRHQHDRGYDQFVRIFYQQGFDRVLLRKHYDSMFTPFMLDETLEHLPAPVKPLVRLGGTAWGYRPIVTAGALAVRAADRLGRDSIADQAGRVIRRVAMRRGALDAMTSGERRY